MAHDAQQCNNFKDPGVQHYGGALFRDIRDDLDDIFIKLPPPTQRSNDSYRSYGGGGPVTVSMAQYYNCAGGCFHGDASVRMFDDTVKKVIFIIFVLTCT